MEVLTSASIAVDICGWVVVVVARAAMAVLNCSTALVIIVLSSVSSFLIDARSVACSELVALTVMFFEVLWVLSLLFPMVVASVTAVEQSES